MDDYKDDKKNDAKDNDAIASYFSDIKKIMDLHGRMVSAVDDGINILPFSPSINYSLATTMAINSKDIVPKAANNNTNNDANDANDKLNILINQKDSIMNFMNEQIASLQKNHNQNIKRNILKELNHKLVEIDEMNEQILKLQNMKNKYLKRNNKNNKQNDDNNNNNTDDEFNDDNDINLDDMIGNDQNIFELLTFHFVGISDDKTNNYSKIKIIERVNAVTVDSTLTITNNIGELKELIYETFDISVINNKHNYNDDLLVLYSHLILNDDNKTLKDVGITNNSLFFISIRDQTEYDNTQQQQQQAQQAIVDINNDDDNNKNIINSNDNNADMDISQILQRLKIEKKLSLDIITLEANVEVFCMPSCGHSMTTSSLYDYALSQCQNFKDILRCAHFKCNVSWEYPIIKQYLLANIEDEILTNIMNEKKKEDDFKDMICREKWICNSECLIYSRSHNQWFIAKITSIIGQNVNEWLIVKYGNNYKKKKKIQRSCKDIKPINDDHPSKFKIGSKCKLYSDQYWCDGDVINIFNDNEGEWLTVKYFEHNKFKTCDIQRYSKDIKLIIQLTDAEENRKKRFDVNYIKMMKTAKLEFLLSRNAMFRNKKYSLRKCIACNGLLYRKNKTIKNNTIKFGTKCRYCLTEFCWSCNKEYTLSHSCDVSFRYQVLEILASCDLKIIGDVDDVPSVRACPSCSTLINHVDACKHMDCNECKQSFCFVCMKLKDKDNGWQCGSYDDACPIHPRQTNKDLPPLTNTKRIKLF